VPGRGPASTITAAACETAGSSSLTRAGAADPLRFALVLKSGPSQPAAIARRKRLAGHRNAIWSSWVRCCGTPLRAGSTSVSGAGQTEAIHARTVGGSGAA